MRPPEMVKIRDRESRIRYRREKFNNYFNNPNTTEFILSHVNLFYNGKPFYPSSAFPSSESLPGRKKGTLIGLNHNEDTIALGILIELDSNSIIFKSPIRSLKGINRVILGDIVIEESYL
jgi:polynucleotide 5'-hydroxyl-kinase GRC3/NOL9